MRKNNLISKKFFSIILTIAVALSVMLTIAWADADGWMSTQSDAAEMANANEANGVATQESIIKNRYYYTDENGSGETPKVDCVHLTSTVTTWDQEWYFVNGGTINGDVTIPEGKTVNIIILDNTTMTINGTLKMAGNGSDSASLKLYGTSSSGTGKIIINNSDSSQNNGNAIMSENGKTAYIHLIGGELTATGTGYNAENSTGVALSNVRLLSEVNETIKRTAEVKCVVTGSDPEQKVEDTQKATSVTISRCECAEKDWKYEQGENNTHRGYCNLCGYVSNWNAETGGYVTCDFSDVTVSAGEDGHYRTCCCGRQETTLTDHTLDFCPTNDGSGHIKSCVYCGYTSAEGSVEAHVYDENGECTVCGFRIVAKDNNGNFYGSVSEALESVNDGGTVTLETHDTSGNKEISEEVEFNRAGAAVTLEMNGYTLKNPYGNSTITVENGTLTIADDAIITQNGGSNDTVKSAICVKGGTLTFEKDVTAQGGACSNAQSPAIEVTGGSIVFKGDLTATGGYYDSNGNNDIQAAAVYAEGGVLDFQKDLNLGGGLTLIKNASLANGLTQGTFWSDASFNPNNVQVKRLSVEGARNYNYLYELLADGYAFVNKDNHNEFPCVSTNMKDWSGDVTIVEHTHTWEPADSGDNYECTACKKACAHEGGYKTGKCEVCGKPCPHALADAGNNYHCNECGEQMYARIQTDEYKWSHFTTLEDAMKAAENGQTILLLLDIDNTGKYSTLTGDNKTVTLDLDGHTINGGWIYVGRNQNGDAFTSSTLEITGSGSFTTSGNLTVGYKAKLDLSEWTGDTISRVNMSNNGDDKSTLVVGKNAGTIGALQYSWGEAKIEKTELTGGTFGSIFIAINNYKVNEILFSDLLAPGYAFQYTESGGICELCDKSRIQRFEEYLQR